MIERIPITLLTGFLGSGKTTLLRHMLGSEAFAETAVLINELGAVGLDHHLVRGASESLRVLENGCVCCTVRDELADVLAELYWDRLHRRIPRFRQVVIETTGLADPAPLLRLLDGSGIAAERYAWSRIVCTVAAVHGPDEPTRRPEALRQIALADVVFITKADLASRADIEEVEARVKAINPAAARYAIARGEAPVGAWQAASTREHRAAFGVRTVETPTFTGRQLHASDVHTFTIELPRVARDRLVRALIELGGRHRHALLRVKGLVRVSDDRRLQVVQGVAGELYPLQPLDAAVDDVISALVFIVTGDIEQAVRSELDAAVAG